MEKDSDDGRFKERGNFADTSLSRCTSPVFLFFFSFFFIFRKSNVKDFGRVLLYSLSWHIGYRAF